MSASGYTTEEDYLNEEGDYDDIAYGGPYGSPYGAPSAPAQALFGLSTPPAAAPPAAAASSSGDKGKGKAEEEGAEVLDIEIKDRKEEEDTPERKATKEQLGKLASVR